jgi:hypothetical protein
MNTYYALYSVALYSPYLYSSSKGARHGKLHVQTILSYWDRLKYYMFDLMNLLVAFS